MHRAGGVEAVGAGAGRVERAGELLADVRRLAGAGDANASGAAMKQLDSSEKGMVEPIGDGEKRSRLAAHVLARVRESIVDGMNLQRHGASLPCRAACSATPQA